QRRRTGHLLQRRTLVVGHRQRGCNQSWHTRHHSPSYITDGTLAARVRSGTELGAKAEVAERTGGHRDWLSLFSTWREETIAELDTVYVEKDIGREFGFATETSERSSPMCTFPYRRSALNRGIDKLKSLIERLELAVAELPDTTATGSLHAQIQSKCRKLYESGDYAEAVEKGFKVVRDELRVLTGYETGSEAIGKGGLYITGAAAAHVDDDFQNGVRFLAMAIDRFETRRATPQMATSAIPFGPTSTYV
ncbi:MAG: hypothetical protein ACR2NT_13905, partial [Acidimicrobiia bacterium]